MAYTVHNGKHGDADRLRKEENNESSDEDENRWPNVTHAKAAPTTPTDSNGGGTRPLVEEATIEED